MDILITFPGGKRVDASFGDTTVQTDQPRDAGGEGRAPAPFDLFLASLGTCAGYYVLAFCQARGIPTAGLSIVQHVKTDASTHLATNVDIDVHLPDGFPDRYREQVLRAAAHCKVKKTLEAPPVVMVTLATTSVASATEGGDHV